MFIFFQTWIACANLTAYMTESIWKEHVATVWLSEPRDEDTERRMCRDKKNGRDYGTLYFVFVHHFFMDLFFIYSSDASN